MSESISLRQHVCMANMSGVVKMPDEVVLKEKDILSTAFAEPLDSCTIPALKWWLLWGGIKVPSLWLTAYMNVGLDAIFPFFLHLESIFLHIECPYP